MAFDWRHYAHLANVLETVALPGCDQEAQHRSAVSRRYYSVIIRARAVAARRSGKRYTKHNTHAWTIGELNSDPDPKANQCGLHLQRLKKLRERCDYDDMVSDLHKVVQKSQRFSKEIDQLLNHL